VWLLLLGLGFGPARAQQGQWTTYTVADGLDRNLVFDVVQDRVGYIWTTSKVLNRFDGRQFKQFPLGGPLYVDPQEQLWIGPLDKNVLLRHDGQSFHELGPADGLPDSHVQAILRDRRGDLWLGTSKPDGGGLGVARYDGKSFHLYTQQDGLGGNDVYCIAEDSRGHLWFGLAAYRSGSGKGVSRFDGQRFTTYTTADGLPSNEVRCIFEDSRRNLWVGTRAGLCRFEGERFESAAWDGLDRSLFVEAMAEDRDGNLWLGTGTVFAAGRYQSQGILRYDGRSLTAFRQGILGECPIQSILQDRDGNLWFTAMGGGLIRYDPSVQRVTEDEPLLASGVVDLAVDQDGAVFFATKAGTLVRHAERRFERLGPEAGLPSEPVTRLVLAGQRRLYVISGPILSRHEAGRFQAVAQERESIIEAKIGPDGSVCLSTEAEVVCRQEGQTLRLRRSAELPDAPVMDFYRDRHGSVWVATRGGLVRASAGTLRTFTVRDGLKNDRIQAGLREGPDGDLWFSGEYSGLYKIHGDSVVNLGQQLQIESLAIHRLYIDRQGRLWVPAWGHGLFRYEAGALEPVGKDAPVFLADITALAEDAAGHLWIGTRGGGCARFDGRSFQSLSTRDGLASPNVKELVPGADGVMWILSPEGSVTRYLPRRSTPTVQVMQVVADRKYSQPVSVELTAGRLAEVRFQFQGLSFNVRPEAMLYSWRLEGVDKAWQPPTGQDYAEYHDLAPGRYTFEVQAVDRDLNFSRASAVVPLIIELPWYLDRVYAIPLGLVGLSVLFALAWSVQQAVVHRRAARRLRVQLREQEIREKEALARKNAELEASYRQLEVAHGRLAETHKELEQKSGELVRSYAELEKALEELKQTQSQLVHSEKMAALGTMVAGVAHEINNPVNFIHANLPSLQEYVDGMKSLIEAFDEGKPKDELEELKEEIDYEFLLEDLDELIRGCKTGTERIRQIVLDLRNFSRKDEAEIKPVDLHEGIDSSLTIVGNMLKGRIQVHKDYGPIPKVPCNAGQINQVVLNLLKNAADAIAEQGQIWIRTRQDGEAVEISVRDSGSGIPPEVLKKIFDPFFTTKPVGKGTGLGLSVSMQIVERHGGRLWAENQPGGGATFFIRLPLNNKK
jgi:signal transduction histidine kinase/ligand-binding sensor domain-containing protein